METMRKHNNFVMNVIHIFIKNVNDGRIAMLRKEEG